MHSEGAAQGGKCPLPLSSFPQARASPGALLAWFSLILSAPGSEVSEYTLMPVLETEPLCAHPQEGRRIRGEHGGGKGLGKLKVFSRESCGEWGYLAGRTWRRALPRSC